MCAGAASAGTARGGRRAGRAGLMPTSADRRAATHRLRAEAYRTAAAHELQEAARFEVAGRTEKRVAAEIAALEVLGWRLLADRRWPGTRAANIDLVAIGPGGVLVIDVKARAEPRIAGGRLFRGQAEADDEGDKLLRMACTVEECAAAAGLAPQLVVPVIVLAGRGEAATAVGRVRVVGEAQLAYWVAARPARVSEERVEELTAALAEALPPHQAAVPAAVSVVLPEPVLPRETEPAAGQLPLGDADELVRALLAAEAAKPIEQWMTFLHPAQTSVVRRAWHGAARIRGPAGTGKTVVALHRAAYLAATRPGRILLTGFVRTLPVVLQGLFRQLSPETVDRVEFIGLNAWARRFLQQRRARLRVDPKAAGGVWKDVWSQGGAPSRLVRLVPDPQYWRDEIDHVIKARGLREFPDYAGADRPGRRVALRREDKAAVW